MMMKKVFVLIMCVTAWGAALFAQSGGAEVGLLNVGNYSKLFLNGGGKPNSRKYFKNVSEEEYIKAAAFGGDTTSVDTSLEIAVLSSCAGAIDVRPVEAVKMLGTAREADLKLGAAVYMEMQAAKFLGNDPAPCAAVLKFITDRGRVTEANIKDFVKQGIAAAVKTEFSKKGKEGVVPSEIYADWESKGYARDAGGRRVNGTELVIKTLTDFFLNPTQDNYVRVCGIMARISGQDIIYDPLYNAIDSALDNIIVSISPALKQKLSSDFSVYNVAYAKQPDDPAFKVFTIPYAVR
jgi:hypothetical protein